MEILKKGSLNIFEHDAIIGSLKDKTQKKKNLATLNQAQG